VLTSPRSILLTVKVILSMESMEYGGAAGNVAAAEVVQQPSSDTYPMMPPASIPPPSEEVFCRLANFEIEKKIGRGQFSTVFRARCQPNGTIVALKKVQVRLQNLFIFCALTKLVLGSIWQKPVQHVCLLVTHISSAVGIWDLYIW